MGDKPADNAAKPAAPASGAAPPAKAPEASSKNGTRVDRSKKVEGKPHRFTKRPRGYVRSKMHHTFFNPIEVLSGNTREKNKQPGNAVAPTPYKGIFSRSEPSREWVDPKKKPEAKPAPAGDAKAAAAPASKPDPKPAPAPAQPAPAPSQPSPAPAPAPTPEQSPTPSPQPAPIVEVQREKEPVIPEQQKTTPSLEATELIVVTKDDLDSGIVCESCEDENSAIKYCEDCALPLCQQCVDSHAKLKVGF